MGVIYINNTDVPHFPLQDGIEIVDGATRLVGDKLITFINRDKPAKRTNFTIMHELYHAIEHYDYDLNGKPCDDKIIDEHTKELQADIGASYLMANDVAVEFCITNKFTFNEMKDRFDFSAPALHSRLINYVEFTLQRGKDEAKEIVYQFRYKDSNFLLGTQILYNYWVEELRQEMIREYANEMRGYY